MFRFVLLAVFTLFTMDQIKIHKKKQTSLKMLMFMFTPRNFPNQPQLCNNQFMKPACILSSKTCKACFSLQGNSLLESIGVEFIFL